MLALSKTFSSPRKALQTLKELSKHEIAPLTFLWDKVEKASQPCSKRSRERDEVREQETNDVSEGVKKECKALFSIFRWLDIALTDVYVIEQAQVSGHCVKKPPSHQPKSACLATAARRFAQFAQMKLWCEMWTQTDRDITKCFFCSFFCSSSFKSARMYLVWQHIFCYTLSSGFLHAHSAGFFRS